MSEETPIPRRDPEAPSVFGPTLVQPLIERQAALFDESQLPLGRELLMPESQQRHQFTGERVARNRERYDAIVQALGEGLGVRQIARAFGVSQHTIECIREREAALVATEKQRTGAKLRRLVRMTLDALEEALIAGAIAPGQLPVTAGILIDKSLNWDGQSVATVTVRHELDQEKVRAMFARLQGPILEAEMVAPDTQSGVCEPNCLPINASSEPVTACVADSSLPAPTTAQSVTNPAPQPDRQPPPTSTSTSSTLQEGGGVQSEWTAPIPR